MPRTVVGKFHQVLIYRMSLILTLINVIDMIIDVI